MGATPATVTSAGPTSCPCVSAAISTAESRRGIPGPAPLPSPLLPTRPSPLPSPVFTGRGPLLRLLQAREHLARDVERGVGGDDVRPGGIGVEDQRVVALGAEALNHGVDSSLNRLEQLLLALLGAGLEIVGALLELLLQLLQVALLLLLGRG